MRRAAKTDGNHLEILRGLRTVPDRDISVFSTHQIGGGFPDLVVAYQGRTMLFEVKAPGGRMTEQQKMFFRNWQGECYVVESLAQALHYLRVK